MKARKTLLALCIAAGSAISVGSGAALAEIVVRIAPPAPRYEAVPVLRPGWAWAPGYWSWNGRRYVWVGGRRVHVRRGYHWVPHRWVEDGGRWRADRGHWDRD